VVFAVVFVGVGIVILVRLAMLVVFVVLVFVVLLIMMWVRVVADVVPTVFVESSLLFTPTPPPRWLCVFVFSLSSLFTSSLGLRNGTDGDGTGVGEGEWCRG
jgi:hypothetical protein